MYDEPDFERVYTIDEYFSLSLDDEYKFIELVNGKLHHRPNRGGSIKASRLNVELMMQLWKLREPDFGHILAHVTVVVDPEKPTLRTPSLIYTSKESFPHPAQDAMQERKGDYFLFSTPNLVVEIKSPAESWMYHKERIEEYQKMGVSLIWVVEWAKETVHVFRRDITEVVVLGRGDVLYGGVLPLDIKIDLSHLFDYK